MDADGAARRRRRPLARGALVLPRRAARPVDGAQRPPAPSRTSPRASGCSTPAGSASRATATAARPGSCWTPRPGRPTGGAWSTRSTRRPRPSRRPACRRCWPTASTPASEERAPQPPPALALVALAAGCGGDDEGEPIPARFATALEDRLDRDRVGRLAGKRRRAARQALDVDEPSVAADRRLAAPRTWTPTCGTRSQRSFDHLFELVARASARPTDQTDTETDAHRDRDHSHRDGDHADRDHHRPPPDTTTTPTTTPDHARRSPTTPEGDRRRRRRGAARRASDRPRPRSPAATGSSAGSARAACPPSSWRPTRCSSARWR